MCLCARLFFFAFARVSLPLFTCHCSQKCVNARAKTTHADDVQHDFLKRRKSRRCQYMHALAAHEAASPSGCIGSQITFPRRRAKQRRHEVSSAHRSLFRHGKLSSVAFRDGELRNGELRNVSALRAKERCRLSHGELRNGELRNVSARRAKSVAASLLCPS